MKNSSDSKQKVRTGYRAEKQEAIPMAARTSPVIAAPPSEAMIAVAAYFRAEQRGFAPGEDLADWFQAETEYQSHFGPGAD